MVVQMVRPASCSRRCISRSELLHPTGSLLCVLCALCRGLLVALALGARAGCVCWRGGACELFVCVSDC